MLRFKGMLPLLPFVLLIAFAQDSYIDSQGHSCGISGTATSAANKTLNTKKNRTVAPQQNELDNNVSLAGLLAPGDDVGRFDEQKGARIVGFVADVTAGGKETCNCGAAQAIDRDTHIELALAKTAPETQRVIVEVTPRIRAEMKKTGIDWTTETLQQPGGGIKGKWVEITGWLLFDDMHINEAENTNPGNPKNWRATCWEIHPITSITILDGPPAELHELHPDLLKTFTSAQANALDRSKEKRNALEDRNKQLLGKYDPDELTEDQDHP